MVGVPRSIFGETREAGRLSLGESLSLAPLLTPGPSLYPAGSLKARKGEPPGHGAEHGSRVR